MELCWSVTDSAKKSVENPTQIAGLRLYCRVMEKSSSNYVASILIGRKQSATALGVSLRTLDYLIAQKQLEARRLGRRVLVVRKSLERFAAVNRPERICPATKGKNNAR